MDRETLEKLAARVDDAAHERRAIRKLSDEHPELDFERAYTIQRLSIARRVQRGESVVGMKMGLTSQAKMEQVGVHEPIYGHLTDEMMRSSGDVLLMGQLIHPRIEPEVAFLLGRDLEGPVTPAQAMLAVEGVCAALEVIDSRFENFEFTLPDVVADNASSSRFLLGATVRRPDQIELGNLGVIMSVDGVDRQLGSTAAIYGHPARSLATLVNMLARRDEFLRAGSVVLAGAATAAEFIEAGQHVLLRVDGLGEVRARVEQ